MRLAGQSKREHSASPVEFPANSVQQQALSAGERLGHAKHFAIWVKQAASWTLISMVRIYQRAISPLLGPCCRFQPTCSEYMVSSIRKHGPLRGGVRGAFRVLRCHPFSRGGYDPP